MKKTILLLLLFINAHLLTAQQKTIPLYNGEVPGSANWNWSEAEKDDSTWKTRIVYNVSKPSLNVFEPAAGTANGTSVVICPGGAFRALSINSEGFDVAKWLAAKGITCFVLRYRLVHSNTDNPVKEMNDKWGSKAFDEENAAIAPLCIADGRTAIAWVRKHHVDYNLDPNRIGIMGFSAGGFVAAAAAYNYDSTNKPNFIAPIYAYFPKEMQSKLAKDAPPLFAVVASNDGLKLADHSVQLYQQWLNENKPAELHAYASGDHGFGMRKQNLSSDTWIERFADWLNDNGWLQKSTYNAALEFYKAKTLGYGSNKTLPYRILYPENYDRNKKYPLLVFLHGSGERGNDNASQLVHGSGLLLLTDNRQQYPAIVVFPQCPANESWVSGIDRFLAAKGNAIFNYDTLSTWPLLAVNELVNQLIKEEAIDSKRLYIGGLSMGGMGTFEMMYRYPGKYAAAWPICGGGQPSAYTKKTAKAAWWIFHGADDAVVPVKYSQEMLARLQALKANVKYSEYPGVNHNSWDNAFAEPTLLSWLFSQQKK
jgi:predicted peptidase